MALAGPESRPITGLQEVNPQKTVTIPNSGEGPKYTIWKAPPTSYYEMSVLPRRLRKSHTGRTTEEALSGIREKNDKELRKLLKQARRKGDTSAITVLTSLLKDNTF